jgi:hypothetical protein
MPHRDPQKHTEYMTKYRAEHPEYVKRKYRLVRAKAIEKRFKISYEEYNRLKLQATHCPICDIEMKGTGASKTAKNVGPQSCYWRTSRIYLSLLQRGTWQLSRRSENSGTRAEMVGAKGVAA